jgi:hypothetical protein
MAYLRVGKENKLFGKSMKMDISPWQVIDEYGKSDGIYFPEGFETDIDMTTIPFTYTSRLTGYDNGWDGFVKYRKFQLQDHHVWEHAHGKAAFSTPYTLTFSNWVPNAEITREGYINIERSKEVLKTFPDLKVFFVNYEELMFVLREGMETLFKQKEIIYNSQASMDRLITLLNTRSITGLREVIGGLMKVREELGARSVIQQEEPLV